MAEIVLSYARQDRALIDKLGEALKHKSLNVWWDREIKSGAAFAAEIEKRIAESDKVIVSWSPHSRGSLWVKAEALQAFDQGKVAQVMLDSVPPPLPFNALHAVNISDWSGDPEHPGIRNLLEAIGIVDASREDTNAASSTLTHKDVLSAGTSFSQRLAQWLMPLLLLVFLAGGIGVWTDMIPPQIALWAGAGMVGVMILILLVLLRDLTRAMKRHPGG